MENAVAASLSAHGRCLVIDCHSFPNLRLPYEDRDASASRPDICIGTDEYHTTNALRDAAVSVFESAGYSVAVNYPFAGALVPASRYQEDPRVAAVMIEVNRKLYMNEQTGARARDFLVTKDLLERVITNDLSKIDN